MIAQMQFLQVNPIQMRLFPTGRMIIMVLRKNLQHFQTLLKMRVQAVARLKIVQ